MKIVHALVGFEANSGISEFVAEVMADLSRKGHSVLFANQFNCEHALDGNVNIVKTNGSLDFSAAIFGTVPDIVHLHAVWAVFSLRVMMWCRSHGLPYVVSPHGGLMPRVFTRGRLKKFIFWHFFLKPLMQRAAAIHCTSEAERKVCEGLGLEGPFVIAPLGVHLPELNAKIDINRLTPQPSNPLSRTILFLGRLSEEKGLLNLLEAWHQLQTEQSSTVSLFSTPISSSRPRLVLAGPDWNGYKRVLDAKIAADHITGVEFTGSVQGTEKDRLYREADIFVLPSPMENFSMVVLEALAYGIPVIATKGTPWRELESEKCGCWIDQGVAPLREALAQLLNAQPSTLNALGANGRALAESRYQWPAISDMLLAKYEEYSHANG